MKERKPTPAVMRNIYFVHEHLNLIKFHSDLNMKHEREFRGNLYWLYEDWLAKNTCTKTEAVKTEPFKKII